MQREGVEVALGFVGRERLMGEEGVGEAALHLLAKQEVVDGVVGLQQALLLRLHRQAGARTQQQQQQTKADHTGSNKRLKSVSAKDRRWEVVKPSRVWVFGRVGVGEDLGNEESS